MATWIKKWTPEEPDFWEGGGKKLAWRTLTITTISLTFSFLVWFLMSAVVTKLPGIGFNFSTEQLFWLAAMPGLAGGTLRLVHMFLIPIYGTRHTITIATLIKLIPVVGIGLAVMNPDTPFWVFVVLALTAGFGGGDFSSFMPSTSLFFPKRKIGTALGIQAGIGNFGVSVAQFMTPVMIGVATLGAGQLFTTVDSVKVAATLSAIPTHEQVELFSRLEAANQTFLLQKVNPALTDSLKTSREPMSNNAMLAALPVQEKAKAIARLPVQKAKQVLNQLGVEGIKTKTIFLQSAAFWIVPFLVIIGIVAWIYLRSVPVKASFKEQLDIFSDKHTWFCTVTYMMTFGTFSGLSAVFPLLIKTLYGGFDGAPDPLSYAFYGPLIGSAARVLFGFVSDRTGGAILTTLTGIFLIVGVVVLLLFDLVAPTSMEQFPMFVAVMLALFFFTGMGNAATFKQYPVIFAQNSRQAAGVIGFTAAVAAYGPFIFSSLIGVVIGATTNANAFFIGIALYFVAATFVNWWYYNRKGCERPS